MNTFAKQVKWLTTMSMAALAIITVIAAPVSAATVNWTGASGSDLFWATAGNWTGGPPTPPDATSDVTFDNTGAAGAAGTLTNEVNADAAVNTVWFGQEQPNYHITQIDAGITLKISGSQSTLPGGIAGSGGPYSLIAGTATAAAPTMINRTTITGDGTLDISNAGGGNTGGDIVVRQTDPTSGSHISILDLSGLETLNANANQLLVGCSTTGANNNRPMGTLYLAKNNTITLNNTDNTNQSAALVIATASSNSNGNSNLSSIYLGQTNTLNADVLLISARKSRGQMLFNTGLFRNSSLTIRAKDGAGRAVAIRLGDMSDNASNPVMGTLNLTGGSADILVDSIIVGRTGNSGTNTQSATGTLTFEKGDIDANTLNVAHYLNANSANTVTGTVNVSGTANLVVNNDLSMATYAGLGATSQGATTATLNFSGGTVNVGGNINTNFITSGAAAPTAGTGIRGTINITGGVVTVGGNISKGGFSSGLSTTTLNLNGGTLDMTVGDIGSAAAPIDTVSFENGLLDNVRQINANILTILSNVTLNVSLGVPLNLGDNFDILNWGSLSGTFTNVNLPTLPGSLSWDTSNLYVDGTIQVVPEPVTWLMLIIAAGLCLLFRRTRHK